MRNYNKKKRQERHKKNREHDLFMNKERYRKYRDSILKSNKEYHLTPKGRYITYKTNAKRRGIIFNIILESFLEIINKSCYYCGDIGSGIDRLDNSIGYISENVVSCCSMCNYMKKTYSEQVFVEKCAKITEHMKTK